MDLFEMMDLPVDHGFTKAPDQTTFFGRVLSLIETSFSSGDFSSSDVAREIEEKFGEPVRLSTVATYLSRLVEKNYLKREKFGNSWVYRRNFLKVGQPSDR